MIRDDVDGDELLDEGLDEDELLDDELELTGDELELTGEELELDGLLLDDFELDGRMRRAAIIGAAFFLDDAFFFRLAAECFFFFGAGFFFFFFISPSFPVACDYVARAPRGASNLEHNNLNIIHVRMIPPGDGPGRAPAIMAA